MPLDLEGLEAMNIGGGKGAWEGYTLQDMQNLTLQQELLDEQEEEQEDEEDREDINLREGDALIVVAKTEEVSHFTILLHPFLYRHGIHVDHSLFDG